MFKMSPLGSAVALALAAAHAQAADALPAQADAAATPTTSPAAASSAGAPTQLERVEVKATRQRLDEARSSLSPDTGSTVYRFDKTDIAKLPLGDATPLNQVLLRTPGVVGDADVGARARRSREPAVPHQRRRHPGIDQRFRADARHPLRRSGRGADRRAACAVRLPHSAKEDLQHVVRIAVVHRASRLRGHSIAIHRPHSRWLYVVSCGTRQPHLARACANG